MTTFTPAKRGDLALFKHVSSHTMMHGKTVREEKWLPAVVTSVSRDGKVKAAERPGTCSWPWKLGAGTDCFVASSSTFRKPVEAILSELGMGVFNSLEDARFALRQYKAA